MGEEQARRREDQRATKVLRSSHPRGEDRTRQERRNGTSQRHGPLGQRQASDDGTPPSYRSSNRPVTAMPTSYSKPPIFFPINNTITPAHSDAVPKNRFHQKFILQSRNERGHIISLGTFERLITPDEAVQQFGQRDYTLKSISPRFKDQWKYKQLKAETSIENGETHLREEIGKLDRRTKLNTYGIVGLGIATAVGFGLSHLRFSNTEGRIAQLEGVVGTLGAENLVCPSCGNRLRRMLQRFCTNCRAQLTWPEALPPPPSALPTTNCAKCGSVLQKSDSFCYYCGESTSATMQNFQFSPR